MKITVIGHWGAYPAAGEATSGYLLEHENENILIDCGSGVLAALQQHMPLTALTRVLITHTHYDHIADLGCLQYACLIDTDLQRRKEPLPIYMAQQEQQDPAHDSMMGSTVHRLVAADRREWGGMKFSFFQTFHGVYCLAVKIQVGSQTLVYTADTYFDESLIGFCQDADLLIAETSFYEEVADARKYGHMNAKEVGTLAAEARVKKLVLTHLPHYGDTRKLLTEAAAHYKGEIELARAGLQFTL